jgi:hypothetical protein
MNSYAINLSASNAATESPIWLSFLTFIVAPAVLGSIIDIGFTQVMGAQHCSFKETEHKCIILGQTNISAIFRELGRAILQCTLLIILVYILREYASVYSKQLYTTLGGVVAIVIFMNTQSDLFEDFRRFNNGLLFRIKHN